MIRTAKILVIIYILLSLGCVFAQPPSLVTPAIEARAEAMLKQLSLEEKIDLIGGVNDFYIREIKHIGLPALKMSDGPMGVRNYGPSTTLGAFASLRAEFRILWRRPVPCGAHGGCLYRRHAGPGCQRDD